MGVPLALALIHYFVILPFVLPPIYGLAFLDILPIRNFFRLTYDGGVFFLCAGRRGHVFTGNVLPGASVFLIYVLAGIGFLILA